ncbi:MAG: hypothetical protein WCA06_18235, partial [Terrimicrobiaceae bacterium]
AYGHAVSHVAADFRRAYLGDLAEIFLEDFAPLSAWRPCVQKAFPKDDYRNFVARCLLHDSPAQFLKEGASTLSKEVSCLHAITCEQLLCLKNEARASPFPAASGHDQKTGEPGIEMLISWEIIEDEAYCTEQFVLLGRDEREWKAAIGSLGFEFAQGGFAVPVAVEVLPFRARKLREARFENRVVLQIVDCHFPIALNSIPGNPFLFRESAEQVFVSREGEEEVRQSIEKAQSIPAEFLACRKVNNHALGAPAHSARKVDLSRRSAASGKDKMPQGRQVGCHPVDLRFEPFDIGMRDAWRAWFPPRRREVGPKQEKLALDLREVGFSRGSR